MLFLTSEARLGLLQPWLQEYVQSLDSQAALAATRATLLPHLLSLITTPSALVQTLGDVTASSSADAVAGAGGAGVSLATLLPLLVAVVEHEALAYLRAVTAWLALPPAHRGSVDTLHAAAAAVRAPMAASAAVVLQAYMGLVQARLRAGRSAAVAAPARGLVTGLLQSGRRVLALALAAVDACTWWFDV